MAVTETWINIRVTERLKRRVERAARRQDRSVSAVIRRAIRRELGRAREDDETGFAPTERAVEQPTA
ncbi:MAG: ribbon-helix-helix protein, CopG family [Deltaproteobacteria bacterium]|nr:MAG: ribbon-helix-helix protein, CopG family [Deltaproteobacteria bacterium]